MTQEKTQPTATIEPTPQPQPQPESTKEEGALGAEDAKVEGRGIVGNLLAVAGAKTYEVVMSMFGQYGYQRRNEFTYHQKIKILDYLQARMSSIYSHFQDQPPIKFADFDPDFLSQETHSLEQMRQRIMKGRTNLEAAEASLQRLANFKLQLVGKYLNEQSYEFERVRYNGLAWGLFLGALVNSTLYRRGSLVRKAAVFTFLGHCFSVVNYNSSLDRYFDAVYPVFRDDAVEFTAQEKEEYGDFRPEGAAVMEE